MGYLLMHGNCEYGWKIEIHTVRKSENTKGLMVNKSVTCQLFPIGRVDSDPVPVSVTTTKQNCVTNTKHRFDHKTSNRFNFKRKLRNAKRATRKMPAIAKCSTSTRRSSCRRGPRRAAPSMSHSLNPGPKDGDRHA